MSRLFDYYGISIKKGEYIFREGDEADVVYMIHRGRVQITKNIRNIKEKVQVLKEGEFLGEMAVIDSLPRSANAVALEDCELIRMDKPSFEKNIRENHQFAISVIRSISERLRETNEMMTVLSLFERSRKLLLELLSSFLHNGKKDAAGQWYLISKEVFIEDFHRKYQWDQELFDEVWIDVFSQSAISVKRDGKGREWLAYKV